ncbi:MAG: metal-sensing transcriptional repressor [bacterium]
MRADPKPVTKLLNTAKGQIEGILRMVGEDRYCVDISTQLLASIAVLKKTNRMVLRAHLDGCLRESLDPAAQAKIAEIVDLMEKIG